MGGASNSLGRGFPKPAGPRPETLLAGYKLISVIHRLFPSNVAMMLLRPMAPPRRGGAPEGRTMGIVHFFSLALLAQLCSFLVEEGHLSHAPQSSQRSL
jgi:hypothetical protein